MTLILKPKTNTFRFQRGTGTGIGKIKLEYFSKRVPADKDTELTVYVDKALGDVAAASFLRQLATWIESGKY